MKELYMLINSFKKEYIQFYSFLGWYREEKRAMKFAVHRIWQEPTNHASDCYFCLVDTSKHKARKNASATMYLDIPSSIAPVAHSVKLPVPTLPLPSKK